jgi:hypothetical protein
MDNLSEMTHREQQPTLAANSLPSEWVDRLFVRFSQMYGNKFISQIGGDIAGTKRAWADGLHGISGYEIADGLKACLRSDWPPTLPEFRSMCRQPRDPETAFRRAAEILGREPIDWKGDAVLYWTVRDVSSYEVRSLPYSAIKRRWEKALREFEDEPSLPPPPEPLLSLPVLPASKEVSRAGVDQLKKIVGMQ